VEHCVVLIVKAEGKSLRAGQSEGGGVNPPLHVGGFASRCELGAFYTAGRSAFEAPFAARCDAEGEQDKQAREEPRVDFGGSLRSPAG
jgi:hypothetical protein